MTGGNLELEKRRRIAGTPAFRSGAVQKLPVELLVKIFLDLRMSLHVTSGPYAWTSVLLVNKTWYQAAIQFPILWNMLDLSITTPLCFVERSRGLPLTVLYDVEDGATPRPLGPYSTCFLRARDLILGGISHDNLREAFGNLTSLPLLEHLGVYPLMDNHSLPDILISGYFPNLTKLLLILSPESGWRYSIRSPNLRTLYISDLCRQNPVTNTELSNCLKNMPLLEHLHMKSVTLLPDEGGELTMIPASTISLRNLLHLVLDGSLEACTALLNGLALPPSTNIDVRCSLPNERPRRLDAIENSLPKLSNVLYDKIALRDDSGALLNPIKSMLVQQFATVGPITERLESSSRVHFLRADSLPNQHDKSMFFSQVRRTNVLAKDSLFENGRCQGVQVILYWSITDEDPTSFYRLDSWPARICSTLPLEQVTTVGVELDPRTTHLKLRDMCPNVTTVIATDEEDEFRGLRYLLNNDGKGNHFYKRFYWAGMKTLVLDRIDFSKPSALHRELDNLRLSLRDLQIADTLTLEEIYFVTSFPTEDITLRARGSLQKLKDAFPEIDIVMLDGEFRKRKIGLFL
ncbi:hypothetical protein BDY19DRAFT_625768 [Irpex rosettiformis]|uniref:Uncharacterized protein n=1 Tax=Irpex rosettiformis TaxID=378272 RepID=A0ACB8UB01_9APHY|nr:hypothetical protein BDY19DRAFT_625768 [Irpex rosettiformis]